MAIRWLVGQIEFINRYLTGDPRQVTASEDSYIQIVGPLYDYAAQGTEYTYRDAIAVFEGVDVTGSIVRTGAVNTAILGPYIVTYSVPGTVPLLTIDMVVTVYDPSAIEVGESGNSDALIDSAIIEPLLYTLQ